MRQHNITISNIFQKSNLNNPPVVGYKATCSCGKSAELLIQNAISKGTANQMEEVKNMLLCQQQQRIYERSTNIGTPTLQPTTGNSLMDARRAVQKKFDESPFNRKK